MSLRGRNCSHSDSDRSRTSATAPSGRLLSVSGFTALLTYLETVVTDKWVCRRLPALLRRSTGTGLALAQGRPVATALQAAVGYLKHPNVFLGVGEPFINSSRQDIEMSCNFPAPGPVLRIQDLFGPTFTHSGSSSQPKSKLRASLTFGDLLLGMYLFPRILQLPALWCAWVEL